MANFTTAIAEENEIIKAADVTYGYEAAINNVALALQGVLGSTQGDYVIGGTVTPYSGGGLNVTIAPIYAHCASTGVSVVETETTEAIPLEAEEDQNRIDIIQVQGVEEGYDYQVRMFNDPASGEKSSESMNTKKQISLSYSVKKGTPGAGFAPSADDGWVKLAEVEVQASSNTIDSAFIKNITARNYGESNDGWTADASATYNPGALSSVFSTFLVAHNDDGSHRAEVIKTDDIDFGTGSEQVKGTDMPIGQSTRLYDEGSLDVRQSSESVTSLLVALVEHINKLYPFANNMLSRYSFAEVSPVAATVEPADDEDTAAGNVDVATGGAMTIDGVSVTGGEAVLLKNQTDKKENGIWAVNALGAWTRYEGFAASDNEALTHKLIQVTGGTQNGGKVFYLEGDTHTIGTDELDFKESNVSQQAVPFAVAMRGEDGQIVVPTTAPANPVEGAVWITP